MNDYLDALFSIPKGETRSYTELAILAGRPGAARAAGRAVAACDERGKAPWHRVVRADGRPKPSSREGLQWRRLRREGSRPRASETIRGWAARTGTKLVGNYPTREFAEAAEVDGLAWNPEGVEPLRDEASALARGFRPLGSDGSEPVPLPLPQRRLPRARAPRGASLTSRLEAVDWPAIAARLERDGATRIRALLSPVECDAILSESSDETRYERGTNMAAKGYGVGAYRYFREPLPEPLPRLREFLYEALAPPGFPERLGGFWQRCRTHGQHRGSCILIAYPTGGINHLHRDVYGPVWFPYQALVMLSKRGRDFLGGQFVLEENGSYREFPVSEGDVLLFKARPHRHGMRIVRRGTRYGVGLVFHLAE